MDDPRVKLMDALLEAVEDIEGVRVQADDADQTEVWLHTTGNVRAWLREERDVLLRVIDQERRDAVCEERAAHDLDRFIAEQREQDPGFREAYDRGAFLDTLTALERIHGYKLDAILPDGTHRYWSTHCRHDNHEECSADRMSGPAVYDKGRQATIARRPAQCKVCSAPCVCPCHKGVNGG